MTLLSRILGMVRDVVVAAYFGSQSEADAFFIAFKIPNFLRRLFAEGAFAQAFVPVLSEYRAKRALADVKQLVDRVTGTLGLTLAAITAVGVAGAPVLIMLFAPGFHDDQGKLELATDMLRITFPYLFLISLTALCGAILNSYGRRMPYPLFRSANHGACLGSVYRRGSAAAVSVAVSGTDQTLANAASQSQRSGC